MDDELFDSTRTRNVRVLDFDADAGYVSEARDLYYVYEADQLFVRVNGVPAGQDVSVLWDQEVVSTTRSERGLDGFGVGATQPDAASQSAGAVAEGPMAPSSSLILRVGQVEVGSYEFAVCRSPGNGEAEEATKKCIQNGARHRLVVQGVRYWGIRAGVGLSVFPNALTQRADRIDGADAYFVRSTYDPEWQGSVPILATLYFPSRYTARELQRNDWDLGLAVGANAVRPHREFYLGVHGGWGPIGIFAGYALLRVQHPTVADGTVIPSTDRPNLSERYRSDRSVEHGFAVALTFDFDVFMRLSDAIGVDGLPGIGGGSSQ